MKIYIDQSGKVEYTSKPTVVAYSNSKSKSLKINGKDKREIQQIFKEAGKPDMFMFRTFGILITILVLPHIDKITSIAIDLEYKGNDHLVKDSFLQALRKKGIFFDKAMIHFVQVGKKHPCHTIAIEVFRGNKKPSVTITAKEVLKYVL